LREKEVGEDSERQLIENRPMSRVRKTALIALSLCLGTLAGIGACSAAVAAILFFFADASWQWAIGFGLAFGGIPGAFIGFYFGVFVGVFKVNQTNKNRKGIK